MCRAVPADACRSCARLPRLNACCSVGAHASHTVTLNPNLPWGAGQAAAPEKEKLRTPAWTDRVLWRPHGGAAQLSYGACTALTLSDHRPVAATFLLQARCQGFLFRIKGSVLS